MRRALLVAALLCACREKGAAPAPPASSAPPAPPERIREQEPNDFQRAQQIPARSAVTGSLQAPRDEDWYRVELKPSAMEALRIEVTAVAGVRPELEVRALADASLLATFRGADELLVRDLSVHLADLPDGGPAVRSVSDAGLADEADGGVMDGGLPATVPAGGGYYLVLKGHSRRGAPLTPYTITATLEAGAPDLEIEPNDDPQHATPLRDTATGFIAPVGDQDWYRIHSDGPAVLHAELTGADRADLELAVFADAGAEKPRLLARVNESGPREPEVLPAVGIPAGDSYVLVQAAARQFEGKWVRDGEDRQTPYRLAVQLFPDDGSTEHERNDEVARGAVLALPILVKGWIWPRKDVDLFRFHVGPGHAPVNIVVTAVRGVDLQLRLYELRGERPPEVIGSSDARRGEGEEKVIAVPLKEADYAVEVSSPRNKDASATQAYTLSVQ